MNRRTACVCAYASLVRRNHSLRSILWVAFVTPRCLRSCWENRRAQRQQGCTLHFDLSKVRRFESLRQTLNSDASLPTRNSRLRSPSPHQVCLRLSKQGYKVRMMSPSVRWSPDVCNTLCRGGWCLQCTPARDGGIPPDDRFLFIMIATN